MKKYVLFVLGAMVFPTLAHGAEIRLTFMDTSNKETSFKVERSLTGNVVDFAPIGNAPQSTVTPPAPVTYTDTGLVEGQNYCYRVAACNTGGCSLPTASVCGKTLVGVPSMPTGLKVEPLPLAPQ